ncbi:MAG: ribosome silencing factor [Elusimicrobia bacterium RIFCSPLOWO2_01_FULL_64_13]|nr:MAG: ribosome silencing factor [Elusimicrobia bacterium RIFCSPHIGHO2_01_FULL_64_10]OGR95720.1 MAG: ribosome silencing factor [Elusimicrobia bacterium RIFCSPLOWO2_01_FULL_64_13]
MRAGPSFFRKAAVAAARGASAKKADGILVFDLTRSQGSVADYVCVMSGNSSVHLRALREAVEEELDRLELSPVHRDGMGSARWSVLDYGGLMVHILRDEDRDFYSLERLWGDARTVSWKAPRKTGRAGKK